jgi:hypothetical protein
MTRKIEIAIGILALLTFIAILIAADTRVVGAHSPPPRPEQPRPDIFQSTTGVGLSALNPLTQKAKIQRGVSYRLLTMPGCITGSIQSDMVKLEAEMARPEVNFRLVRNDTVFDFTVRINCGSEQIRICGSTNTFCLGRGFPYSPDVEISDILSYYQPDTRLSILCHEICGHAIATWNEQYALCGRSCGFASSPNWRDFMNTGPESRHGFETIEIERWHRTMYEPAPISPWGDCHLWDSTTGVTGCWHIATGTWVGSNGWTYTVATGIWTARRFDTPWGGYYNAAMDRWVSGSGDVHDWVSGWQAHP